MLELVLVILTGVELVVLSQSAQVSVDEELVLVVSLTGSEDEADQSDQLAAAVPARPRARTEV